MKSSVSQLARKVGRQPKAQLPETSEQDRILSEAINALCKHDVGSITIKDIAAQCNMNSAMIYYYFKSKDRLISAAIEGALNYVITLFSNLEVSIKDPTKRLEGWFLLHERQDSEFAKLMKVIFNYSFSNESIPRVDILIKKMYAVEVGILKSTIRECQANGEFKNIVAENCARLISVYLDGLFVAAAVQKNFDIRKHIAILRSFLLEKV